MMNRVRKLKLYWADLQHISWELFSTPIVIQTFPGTHGYGNLQKNIGSLTSPLATFDSSPNERVNEPLRLPKHPPTAPWEWNIYLHLPYI